MVGLTPAELESLNELIHIDHIYVKQQPQEPEMVVEEQPPTEEIEIECAHELENSMEEEIHVLTSVPETSETEVFNALPMSPLSQLTDSPLSFNEQDDFDMSDFANLSGNDDVMYAFSGTDMEAPISLDFLDHIGLDAANDALTTSEVESGILAISCPGTDFGMKLAIQEPVLHTPEILDDLEQFLNFKLDSPEAASPLSNSYSDSDFYETQELAFSPSGSESSSLLDDLSWHDPFTDLFPDLNKI